MSKAAMFVSGLASAPGPGDAAARQFRPLAGKIVRADPSAAMSERERQAHERGRKEGFDEGTRRALEQARRERANHGAQLERVLAELRARFAELEEAGADLVLDLAVEMARQVVRSHVEVRRDAVLAPLREAVALVIDQHAHPRVHLNPNDFDLLRAELEADGVFKGCRFIADAAVARGGCRVETNQGEVDAQLAKRWQRVMAALGIEAEAP